MPSLKINAVHEFCLAFDEYFNVHFLGYYVLEGKRFTPFYKWFGFRSSKASIWLSDFTNVTKESLIDVRRPFKPVQYCVLRQLLIPSHWVSGLQFVELLLFQWSFVGVFWEEFSYFLIVSDSLNAPWTVSLEMPNWLTNPLMKIICQELVHLFGSFAPLTKD